MRRPRRRIRWDLLLMLALGTAAVAITEGLGSGTSGDQSRMLRASRLMQSGIEAISAHRMTGGPALDRGADINATGLIGAQFSPMTTTVGSLEAKRTTTNPNMAGLVVFLLAEAGVQEGDFIAVAASGSFPGLILATLCAADAMNLDVALISSLGASQWGANLADFTWLDIEDVLCESGIISRRSSAATVGGDLDIGRDLSDETRTRLRARIEGSGAVLIDDPDLADNVAERMSVYRTAAGDRPSAAFVNIGGAWANLGTDASVLNLSPGVNEIEILPRSERRGVVHAMAADGVPIIHLLNIRELAQRFGMPWDPSPLPKPGLLHFTQENHRAPIHVIAVASSYLGIVAVWLLRLHVRRRQPRRRRGRAGQGS